MPLQAATPYYVAIQASTIKLMLKHTIHIIGLGVAEPLELTQSASNALRDADVLVAWPRHQALILDSALGHQTQRVVVQQLSELKTAFNIQQAKKFAILASGDPLHFGIGRWLHKHFSEHNLHFYPAISSIQAACHQQALSLQDVTVISLHGRPFESLYPQLKKNRTLLILTDKHSQPQALAKACIDANFKQSIITVHENLGQAQARSRCFDAQTLSHSTLDFSTLHISVIELKGLGEVQAEFPGIADKHFLTGKAPGEGMITKREVRLNILSLLQAAAGDIIWDIGAGCGSVAIELAYWNTNTHVYAVEYHTERLHYLASNRQHFGVVRNLHIISGRAPECLTDLPKPNKIFIGGSGGKLQTLLHDSWNILPANGVLVVSAVTEASKVILQDFATTHAEQAVIDSLEISVKRKHFHKRDIAITQKLPVELFSLTKLGIQQA